VETRGLAGGGFRFLRGLVVVVFRLGWGVGVRGESEVEVVVVVRGDRKEGWREECG